MVYNMTKEKQKEIFKKSMDILNIIKDIPEKISKEKKE